MDNSRKKFLIITASVLLHMVGMFVIFVLYHQPSGDLFADFDPSKAIDITETIFHDPAPDNSSAHQATQQPSSIFDDWGQFKPRASTLSNSMEMPDGPIGIEMPGENGTDDAHEQETESSEDSGDTPQTETQNENPLEFSPTISFDQDNFSTQPAASLEANGLEASSNVKKKTPSHPAASAEAACFDKLSTNGKSEGAKEHASASRRKARKALAGITRGYLQQLQDEGENLIKTLGGDPNKKPTAEQLKYERYLAKIQWCLQNAHSINQEKCQLQEPINSAMRIYFILNREGKMTGFKIMQSSGKAYVDQYISSLFQFASSSFPPLPAYVKEDHLPLTYTVMVNWNTASPMGFSRY